MNILWRIAIAAGCYVAFIYIAPLFLSVIDVTVDGKLLALVKALAAVAAIAYVVWGRHTYPWARP